MNKDTRLVYDADFYRLSAIMFSNKYLNKEAEILKYFEQIGCPIPPERFSKASDYNDWIDNYKSIIRDNPEAKTPDSFIKSILEYFELDPKNESYFMRLKWFFFFNKDQGPVIPVNSPKTKWENGQLWVLLPDWTKQEYYESWWNNIAFQLDKYPSRKKKDKERTSFKRDFLIYQLYKQKMLDKKNGIWKGSMSINFFLFPEFEEICKKYGRIDSPSELKKIVSYFNRLLAHVPIIDTDKQAA